MARRRRVKLWGRFRLRRMRSNAGEKRRRLHQNGAGAADHPRKENLAKEIVELVVSPYRKSVTGRAVRSVLAWEKGEFVPMTLADWDVEKALSPWLCRDLAAARLHEQDGGR